MFIFLSMWLNPAAKVVDKFINALNDSLQTSPDDYIIWELQNDPFLSLLMDQDIILNHKTIKINKDGRNRLKVNSSLSTKSGSINVWFDLAKIDNKWLITKLPKTTYIEAGVPLKIQKKDKELFEYQIDVSGTHIYSKLSSPESSMNIGIPASLILVGDYIVEYQHLIPLHLNRIMSTSAQHIEDALMGNIPIDGSFNIYTMSEDIPTHLEDNIIPMGISNVTLYSSASHKNKSLVAYIDPSNFSYNTIRVVLNDSQFQNLIHEEISLTSTKGLVVKNLVDNLNFDIAEDEEVRFKYDGQGNSLLYHQGRLIETSKNRWYILPHMDGNIIVNSIRRAHTGNSSGTLYRGNMEISSNNQGIVLVNEVNLEEYLYSVVPSEMPVKFGLESLKVQAIAARAYGVRCFKSKGFAHLGGHVDDSTSSQVYNNIEENPIAIEAVDQTRGLIPVFEDQVIDARFFSTSYGYTANFHEVWSVNEVFPSIEVPYLIAKPQFLGDTTSLYNEENFKAFISNKDFEGYDHFSPFFRWNLSMTKEQLEAIIQQNIMPLQKKQPSFVLMRDTDGAFVQQDIPENLGELQNISTTTRGQGGNVIELEITTTKGVYRVIKELNIRQLLKPINLISEEQPVEIHRHDGSIVNDFPILPSSFFFIDTSRDRDGNLSNIALKGGGYGHGVGMSQYGTYGLTLLGKSYIDIIEHYYPGSQIQNLY